jgi:hypothetical protein
LAQATIGLPSGVLTQPGNQNKNRIKVKNSSKKPMLYRPLKKKRSTGERREMPSSPAGWEWGIQAECMSP